MSLSPTTSVSNGSESTSKKRRTGSMDTNMNPESPMQQQSQQLPHIPKRGARACTNCRRGKNRCEGEVKYPILSFNRSALAHRGPYPRPGPALCTSRRLADDARPAESLVYSKNPKRKVFRHYPMQVLSEYQFLRVQHVLLLMPPSKPSRRLSRLEGQYLVSSFLAVPRRGRDYH